MLLSIQKKQGQPTSEANSDVTVNRNSRRTPSLLAGLRDKVPGDLATNHHTGAMVVKVSVIRVGKVRISVGKQPILIRDYANNNSVSGAKSSFRDGQENKKYRRRHSRYRLQRDQ